MTVLVGVRCTDGVVVGADSIATSGDGAHGFAQLPTDKLQVIGDRIILAGTGSVGLGQRFSAIVKDHWNKKIFQQSLLDCAKSLTANAIRDFQSTGIQQRAQTGFGFGALLAAPLDADHQLVEFALADFQPEIKKDKLHFVTMGSGQMLADPFMAFISRVLWKEQAPDVQTAMFGVYWALFHTIKYAPGGVGHPIRLAVLSKVGGDWRARILEEAELQEQAQHIDMIEARIAEYPADVIKAAQAEPPPAPPAGE